jgi:outer membrane protein TolC
MKNKYLSPAIVFSFAMACSLSGQALTLEEAVQTNYNSSHELKQLRLESESRKWGETKAFAGYLPKLELSASHLFDERFEELELEFNGASLVMPAIQPYTSLGLSASVEIFSGFQTVNETAAAQAASLAAAHRLTRAEQKATATVRTLFFKALGSQALVDVAQQNIATLESHMKDVQARVRGGLSTRFDTLRFEVQLEEARSEKLASENNVVIQRAKLFQTIGTSDDGKPLVGKLPEDFSRIDLSKLDQKESVREDREALVLTAQEYASSAKAAQAHWYPRISVFGSQEWYNNYNESITGSDERFKSAYSVGMLLRWNLYDGGSSFANQRQLALSHQAAIEQLAKIDDSVPVEIEEAKRRLSYNIINYTAKMSSVRKSEEAVRLARGALSAGAITNTEVLDVVLDLNRAKAATVKSQIDAVEALGDLELALGHTI